MNNAVKPFSVVIKSVNQVIRQLRSDGFFEVLSSWSQQISRKQKGLILLGSGLVIGTLIVSPSPSDVRPVNVYARSTSTAWVLPRPAWGCIALLPTKLNTPPRIACDFSIKSVHLTELTNLRPEATYKTFVISGFRPLLFRMPTVTTQAISEEMPSMPQPGYGSVVFADEKVKGALVLVYANTNKPQYAVAGLTNSQGNYAVDLANLTNETNSYVIDAYSGTTRLARLESDIRMSTPFPPIILRDQLVPWWEQLQQQVRSIF